MKRYYLQPSIIYNTHDLNDRRAFVNRKLITGFSIKPDELDLRTKLFQVNMTEVCFIIVS